MSSAVKRVLVVEDTAVTRFSLRQVLQDHGYEVEEAASGEEALAKAAAQPEPLDLVVLDIFLPGMDGLAVLRELKARPKTRHAPVMLLTASSSAAIVRQAIDLGAVDYLVKPFSPEELVRRVEKLIGPGRRRGQGPLADLLAALRLEANRAAYPENGSDPAALYSHALAVLSGHGQPAGRGAPEKDGGCGEDGPGAAGGPAG